MHAILDRGPLQGCVYSGPVDKKLRERFGRNAQVARLRASTDQERPVGRDPLWAQTLVVKDEGVLISGNELHPRALKSSPDGVA